MKLSAIQCCFALLLALVCVDTTASAISDSNYTESADSDFTLNTLGELNEVSPGPDNGIIAGVDTADDVVAADEELTMVDTSVVGDVLLEKEREVTSCALDVTERADPFTDTKSDESDTELDDKLGSGLDLEGLFDQLDAAISELQTVKIERAAVAAALKEKEHIEQLLHDQMSSLKNEVASLTATVAELHLQIENCKVSVQSGKENINEVATLHETEKKSLLDQVAVAERNASSLAIKVKLERNERTIAKLSYENCLLELDGVRSGQLDEVAELKSELAALKRSRETKCKPCSASKREGGQGASGSMSTSGECDTSACIDSFVSKYLFFWAEEHQSQQQPTPIKSAGAEAPRLDASKTSSHEQQKHSTVPAPKLPRNAGDESRNLQYEEVMGYLQFAMRATMIGADWVRTQCATYIYPVLFRIIFYEIDVVCTIVGACIKAAVTLWDGYLSPAWFNTVLPSLQEFYSNQIVPVYMKHLHPLYVAHAESTVNAVFVYYARNEDWFDQHLGDPLDYIIGRLHYACYFTAVFFSPPELGYNLQAVWHYMQAFVPTVIEQLCSIEPIQAQLGGQCEVVVSICVYLTVALFLYLARRVIFGVVALLVMLVLSPLLLAVYLLAKMVALFKPRKKSSKRSAASASRDGSTRGNSSGSGSGSARQTAKYPVAGSTRPLAVGFEGIGAGGPLSSSAAQISTRNLPMNAPLINPEPGSHALGSSPGPGGAAQYNAVGSAGSGAVRIRPRSDAPPTGSLGAPARPSAVSRSPSNSSSNQAPAQQIYSRQISHSSGYGHSSSEEAALGV